MKKELYDLAAWGIDTAKAAGAAGCRININSARTVEIGYRERKPENIKEASTKSLSLEVFVNGRYSSMATSDLRKPALKEFIGRAVAQTKLWPKIHSGLFQIRNTIKAEKMWIWR